MSWADGHIKRLQAGQDVQFRPRGHSMTGRISDGQLVTVIPLNPQTPPEVGEVVLCRLRGKQLVHLITAVRGAGEKAQYQISNNKGHVNGWIPRRAIYGVVIKVEN